MHKQKKGGAMKAGIIFTGSGPLLALTTYESFIDPKFVEKLNTKGVKKFIACEVPVDTVKARYGMHFTIIVNDLKQTDDLRVLDYNGHHVFSNFGFSEFGEPQYYE
jgi:hypothetical protein